MERLLELQHVQSGCSTNEKPYGVGITRIMALCVGDAADVAVRAREVMRVVLEHSTDNWPSPNEWLRILPDWFIAACVAEWTQEEEDAWIEWWKSLNPADRLHVQKQGKWEIDAWLYQLKPETRGWWWWDIKVGAPDRLVLEVVTEGLPCGFADAEWLLRAAGAKHTTVEA